MHRAVSVVVVGVFDELLRALEEIADVGAEPGVVAGDADVAVAAVTGGFECSVQRLVKRCALGGAPSWVQQVAGGEDPGLAGAQGGVDSRTSGAGIEGDIPAAGQFMIGDPVPGEQRTPGSQMWRS